MRQRQAVAQAPDQIRVADEVPRKGHRGGAAVRHCGLGRGAVEAVVEDQRGTETFAREAEGIDVRHRRAHHMRVGQAQPSCLARQRRVGRRRVGIGGVVVGVARVEAQAYPARPDRIGHRLQALQRETHPVVDAAAVFVATLVGAGTHELHRQVAAGAMQFDTVEAGPARIQRGLTVFGHHRADFVRGQFARHVVRLHAGVVGEDFAGGADRRRRHRLDALALDVAAADPTRVHDLQHDASAARMHGLGDLAPAVDLRRRGDARLAAIGLPGGTRPGAFGDDQAGGGALGVVRHHQLAGHAPGVGAVARHRRHHDAVGQLELAQPQRAEKMREGGHAGTHSAVTSTDERPPSTGRLAPVM